MPKNLITFSHVTKKYNGHAVVKDLSLNIHEGELFVLVGASGSGKTTTLKMINRLVQQDAGTITFSGKDITSYDLRKLRWDIGYVLQQIALFPTMTVGQNIALIPEMKGWSKAEVKKTVNDLLPEVGLNAKTYKNRMPSALSGGEQQRVGILRALASKPPLVLMDEPFSALDPLARTQLQDLVLKLHHQLGMTIVFVTHDMNEAVKLGQRIAVMKKGVLQQLATPDEIANQPANNFVSDFFASASHSLLDTPLASLASYGQEADQPDSDQADRLDGTTPLRDVLSRLAQAQNVTVSADGRIFKVTAQNVMQFLAENQ